MQQLLIWILSGLAVGWLVRIAMKSRREYGVIGDLTLGSLGALIGQTLARSLGVIGPDDVRVHVFFAATGAVALVGGLRLLRHLFQVTGLPPLPQAGALVDLESQVRRLSEVERRVLAALLGHKPTARDPTRAFDEKLTFGERVADRVAALGGSWTFIGVFAVILLGWILLNDSLAQAFDPYPYILLNLILSCLAALQAPVIMMSQNRQAAHDRIDARNDYEVNLRAELEIMSLHAKLDAVKQAEWAEILRVQKEQLDVLRRLETALGRSGSLG